MANQNRTGVDPGDDEGTEPRRVERAASENAAPAALDPHDIFASTGVVPYAWDVATDALTWGANACDVLEVADAALIASGGRYARLIDHKDGRSRVDAVMNSGMKDDGAGVPYEVQYALKPTPDSAPLHWIEDTGRWFAGADGTPARAHGVVRVINARREQEQQLAYLSRFDPLTGEMNRWHLTAVLEQTLEEAMQAALVLRLPAGRDRQSRPHQRSLRLQYRRRGDRGGRRRASARRCAARTISAGSPATSSASS